MASASSNTPVMFSSSTKTAFLRYLRENPNTRRVSYAEKAIIIEWLTDPHKRPTTQKEFSRRNYVRKTFEWDEKTQTLLAVGKSNEQKNRVVITEDTIADLVGFVHQENSHAGWDATWRAVNTSYYGILRSDLIFLLRQCQTCAQNPSKRPKASAMTLNAQPVNHESFEFLEMGDVPKEFDTEDGLGRSSGDDLYL
jgi:hypothetical protein